MKAKEALQKFFEEKDLPSRTFTVKHNGETHIVDSEFLKDVIINHTPAHEQEQIRAIIAKIDFQNGDINQFLEHLATAYVKSNF
ncbi:MAG: hypothetical protein H0Z33_11120 [Bacillaceae bacterium]|nr:hypothetical protein [Bacillaceae bacterium]